MSSFPLRALTFEGRSPVFPGVAAEVESCQSQYFQALEARLVGVNLESLVKKSLDSFWSHDTCVAIPHVLRRVTSCIYDISVYINMI